MAAIHSKNSRFLVLTLAFLGLGLIAYGWNALNQAKPGPAYSLTNLQGKTVKSEDLRGKVVMLNFWATSCTTCVAEMPEMVATYNKYHQQGLEFFAVAMSYDPPNYVVNFAETRKLPFHVVLDTQGQIARSFNDVKLTPTTYVLDKQGRILKRYVGKPDFTELHQLLEAQLKA